MRYVQHNESFIALRRSIQHHGWFGAFYMYTCLHVQIHVYIHVYMLAYKGGLVLCFKLKCVILHKMHGLECIFDSRILKKSTAKVMNQATGDVPASDSILHTIHRSQFLG